MSRVETLAKDKAAPAVQELYKIIEKKMGRVPNLMQTMGHSPAVLKGYLALSEAVNQTSLNPKLREEIAIIVGQTNQCNYCLSAHSAIAKAAGISDQEIMDARKAHSNDSKTQAILTFAKIVVEKKGAVNDQDVADLKANGVNEAELTEIIMTIALNMFTNYFNHITDPKIDFPVAAKLS